MSNSPKSQNEIAWGQLIEKYDIFKVLGAEET